ncbi:unnamed protein product [Musa acuminata var. zebrina]
MSLLLKLRLLRTNKKMLNRSSMPKVIGVFTWLRCRWCCYDFVQAEELAAALKASQNFGQGDPTAGVSCAPKLRGSYILFPPYDLLSTEVLDQVLKGSMSAIKGSMHLPPCSVVCLCNHVLQVWLHSLSPSNTLFSSMYA